MYKGTVDFVAEIKGNGLTFPRFDFDPHEPGVVKVEIEGCGGHVIRSTVHLTAVESREVGISVAAKVITSALSRLSLCENIAIENVCQEREDFSSLEDQPGDYVLVVDPGMHTLTGEVIQLTVGRSAAEIKSQLEKPGAPGERFYGLFRSARQSTGPIEEFMHLYHILTVLFNETQPNIDNNIISLDPSVPQTPSPKYAGRMETVYTRLRNEFAHKRKGIDLEQTKAEMTQRLGNLRMLVRKAIEVGSMSQKE